VGVEVDGAGGAPARVGGDLADPAPCLQLRTVTNSRRPMGDVEGRFGSLGTTGFAGADSGAAGQFAHALGCDRVGSRPPMPTEFVHSGRRAATDFADRVWGQRWDHARRVHRIPFDTGHTDRASILSW